MKICKWVHSKLTLSSLIFSCGWASDDSQPAVDARLRWAPRSFSFYVFMIVIIRDHTDISRDAGRMQRGAEVPKNLHQTYDTINPQPIHCHFCQYSVFITELIRSIRGTTVLYCERWSSEEICRAKDVALWDRFIMRRATMFFVFFFFPLNVLQWHRVCGGWAPGRHRPEVGNSCLLNVVFSAAWTCEAAARQTSSIMSGRASLSRGGRQPASAGRRVRCGRGGREAGN